MIIINLENNFVNMFVPNGCDQHLMGIDSLMCENMDYWKNVSFNICYNLNHLFYSFMPFNPCLNEHDYSVMHFSSTKIVCCNLAKRKRSKFGLIWFI